MAVTVAGRSYGIGQILALLVLIICVVLMVIGHPLSPMIILGLIGTLALALLL